MSRPPLRAALTRLAVAASVGSVCAVLAPMPALAEAWTTLVDQVPVEPGRAATGVVPFQMIALSWNGPADAAVRLETHTGAGWAEVPVDRPGPDVGPDDSSAEASTTGNQTFSEPAWVGDADGYRVSSGSADLPSAATRIIAHLIRQERRLVPSWTDAPAGAAVPADGPPVNLRSSWGAADPVQPNSVAATVRFAVVHHTASSNAYAPGDVPAILRSIQAFHQQSRGWNDIAYNFLVDRFGGIWEGRAGGIGRPIVGSHAANFNTGSVGVSLLGDFVSTQATAEAIDATATLIGWKLALHGVDPSGTTTVVAPAGTIFPEGQTVTLPTVVGHRDVGQTDCPGSVWTQLGGIRTAAARRARYVTGVLDSITQVSPRTVRVTGWAFDRRAGDALQVVGHVDSDRAATSTASRARPDVAAAFPGAPGATGFSFEIPLGFGRQRVCVSAAELSYGALTRLGCATFDVPRPPPAPGTATDPIGGLEDITNISLLGRIRGWALDLDSPGSTEVVVTVNGRPAARTPASIDRPDIAVLHPTAGPAHGYELDVALDPGPNTVCVVGVNRGRGADTSLGCRDVPYDPAPVGVLDSVVRSRSSAIVSGWALDRDTAGPVGVLVTLRGKLVAGAMATSSRPILAAFFPGYGEAHGFDVRLPLPRGRSEICAFAANVGPGPTGVFLGCRTVRR